MNTEKKPFVKPELKKEADLAEVTHSTFGSGD